MGRSLASRLDQLEEQLEDLEESIHPDDYSLKMGAKLGLTEAEVIAVWNQEARGWPMSVEVVTRMIMGLHEAATRKAAGDGA